MTGDHREELFGGAYVSLREMEESDAGLIVQWRNRDEIKEWLIQWKPLTVEAHLKWFQEAKARGEILLMFYTLEGEPVGTSSVYNLDHPKTSAEWGRICAARIGRHPKQMLEGCYLVNRICFEALGMFRLHLEVASENHRALRLYRFLGYVQEGLRRKHWVHPGGYFDVIQMGMCAEEFNEQRKALEARLYPDIPVPEITNRDAGRIRAALGR